MCVAVQVEVVVQSSSAAEEEGQIVVVVQSVTTIAEQVEGVVLASLWLASLCLGVLVGWLSLSGSSGSE